MNLGDRVAKLSWAQFNHSEPKERAFDHFMEEVCSQCKSHRVSVNECIWQCVMGARVKQMILDSFAKMN